ncbi:1190_t:CDS:2, partial [Gigaspora rosea]
PFIEALERRCLLIIKILNKEMLTSDDDNETKRQLLEIDNTLQEICTDENFTRWGSVLRDLQEKPET